MWKGEMEKSNSPIQKRPRRHPRPLHPPLPFPQILLHRKFLLKQKLRLFPQLPIACITTKFTRHKQFHARFKRRVDDLVLLIDVDEGGNDGVLAFEDIDEGAVQFRGGEGEIDAVGLVDFGGEGRGGDGAGKDGNLLRSGGGVGEEGGEDGETDLARCLQ